LCKKAGCNGSVVQRAKALLANLQLAKSKRQRSAIEPIRSRQARLFQKSEAIFEKDASVRAQIANLVIFAIKKF